MTAKPHTALLPEAVHRADGLLVLDKDTLLEVGVMVCQSHIGLRDDVRSQFHSTLPMGAYEWANGYGLGGSPGAPDRLNTSAEAPRNAWVEKGLHKRRALRVHVTLPVSESTTDFRVPRYEYKPGIHVVGEDLVVNLDCTNLHLLFGSPKDKGTTEAVPMDPAQLKALWRVLWTVTGCDEFVMVGDEVA